MKMPFVGKNWKEVFNRESLRTGELAAIILAVIALVAALCATYWSWSLFDEQVKLRQDFMGLKNQQDQVGQQYEFWLKQLQKERAAVNGQTDNNPAQ